MFQLTIALFLRIFSNPLGNVFQKKLTSAGVRSAFVNFAAYLLLSFFVLIPALHLHWIYSVSFWAFAICGGLMGALGNGFLIGALKNGELSVLGPINSYKSVVAMIAGIFVLKEIPSFLGLAGMGMIIYGSWFIFDTLDEKFSFALLKRKDIQFRVYAMIFCAIEAVFIKKVIEESSVLISFILWCWFGALFSFVLMLLLKIDVKSEIKKTSPTQALMYLYLVFCLAIMQLSTNYVFEHLNISYSLALFQLSSLISVVFGYKIFKEQNLGKKILATLIMIAGSAMIIFLS